MRRWSLSTGRPLALRAGTRVDAAAKHYHENPGKLDRDLAAYTQGQTDAGILRPTAQDWMRERDLVIV